MGVGSKYITTEDLCRLVKIFRLKAFIIGSARAIEMTNGANGEWMFDEDGLVPHGLLFLHDALGLSG